MWRLHGKENTWTAVSGKEMSCFVGHVHSLKQGSCFSRTQVDNSFQWQRETENISGCLLFSQWLSIAFYFWVVNDCVQKPTAKHILRGFVGYSSRLWDELVDSKDRVLSGMLQSMRQQLGTLEGDDFSVQALPRCFNPRTTPAFTQLKEVCLWSPSLETHHLCLALTQLGENAQDSVTGFPQGSLGSFLLWSAWLAGIFVQGI